MSSRRYGEDRLQHFAFRICALSRCHAQRKRLCPNSTLLKTLDMGTLPRFSEVDGSVRTITLVVQASHIELQRKAAVSTVSVAASQVRLRTELVD